MAVVVGLQKWPLLEVVVVTCIYVRTYKLYYICTYIYIPHFLAKFVLTLRSKGKGFVSTFLSEMLGVSDFRSV
jgi:hypothetical protein